jgi:hypothetical protein
LRGFGVDLRYSSCRLYNGCVIIFKREEEIMKKIWINKARSCKEAEEFDRNYYFNMTKKERLEIMQFLRDTYMKIKRGLRNEGRKGLRRVIKIIQ